MHSTPVTRAMTFVLLSCFATVAVSTSAASSQDDGLARHRLLAADFGDPAPPPTAERALEKASRASDKAGMAIDEAAKAEEEANSAKKQATIATDEATKATSRAEDAAKKAEAAAEKAAQAAEKMQGVSQKVEKAVSDAAEVSHSSELSAASNRLTHRVGGYASLWGDPFPTTLGLNLAYNVYDWARVNVGVGSDTTNAFRTATAGIGAKFLIPGWQLTPEAGINLSFTKTDNPTAARNVRGFDPSGAHPYANVGIDWETGIGLNFGVGYILPLQSGIGGSYYLNGGIFL